MGAPRRKNLIRSRRRVADDGEEEEEEGSVAAGVEDDSLSEGSAISDADEDADAEGSDGDDVVSTKENPKAAPIANGHKGKSDGSGLQMSTTSTKPSFTAQMADTEVMMNGFRVSGEEDEGVAFEDIGGSSEVQPSNEVAHGSPETSNADTLGDTLGERRRREHEEYRKKRDADPAFVPNRGGFFMHDHRSAAPGQNGFRPFLRGRGRGRGISRGPYQSSNQNSGPTDSPWAHDLHEVIIQPDSHAASDQTSTTGPNKQYPIHTHAKAQPPNRSFSRTARIGNVQIRILLEGMTDPIVFSAVPVNQHTRLPHHRPPLRRDKPVRISLPEMPIRYIFPSIDRSFIFIPRALRPNQQGFGRLRGRGSLGGGHSVFGGVSSRRTSAYAGSAYSPSAALSRRSSLAREIPADVGAGAGAVQRMAPVVRLPPAAQQVQPATQQFVTDASMNPTINLPQASAYSIPQRPQLRENRPTTLPMQHPKPQRTLQVADIDSPATLEFNPPQQQQQLPFHQQVPAQIAGQTYSAEYRHSRHPSHPSQASGETPLPDRAIHAQPFQPYPYQHPPTFYPHQYPPAVYYYPPPDQVSGAPPAAAPAFVPGQQYLYPVPFTPTSAHTQQPQPHQASESNSQSGTVAQEINGMVYYLDPSQIAASAEPPAAYPPPGYIMPPPDGVVGMGGMMTPPMYYPPAPPPAYYTPQ